MFNSHHENFLNVNTEESLFEKCILELQRQIFPESSNRLLKGERERTPDRLKLSTFVEATSKLQLEAWQKHMCDRLEKLTYQKGQRILLHKPPQHGGSVIVSQRLPAYLVGDDPETRVRVACYNMEHATKFTAINKEIMLSPEYRSLFSQKARELYVPKRSSDIEFSTKAREEAKDAQASIVALGLKTGFVGQGADTLIIDDPYASPQDAQSIAVRASTWLFWTGSASVRIDEDTNVVVMFHRYGEEDFAGELIANEGLQVNGGRWELISYRAEWDGDSRPEVGGPDPLNRQKGVYLSPRKAAQPGYYAEQKRNPQIWQSQFQGKPSNAEGNFFSIRNLVVIPRMPCKIAKICRAWDIASSTDGDWTVGVLMALGVDEYVYVLDVVRIRKNTDERNKVIKRTALNDRRKYPDVVTRLPEDPAAAGKDMSVSFRKLLKGFNIIIKGVRGDKETRADPWSGYVNSNLARLVYDGPMGLDSNGDPISWTVPFINEHRTFPNSVKKDQVDAASDAFSEIVLEEGIPEGYSFDTMGFSEDEDREINNIADVENDEELMLLEIMSGMDDLSEDYENEMQPLASVVSLSDSHDGIIIDGKIYIANKETNRFSKQTATTPRAKREATASIKTKIRRNRHSRSN